MSRWLLVAIILGCLPRAHAQEAMWLPDALIFWERVAEHRPGPESDPAHWFIVTIAADGHVESATPVPSSILSPADVEAAQASLLSRTYKPWYWDGKPVRVRQIDSAPRLRPELGLLADTGPPFPEHPDLATVKIVMNRGVYDVTLTGDGTIHFSGYASAGMTQHTGVVLPGEYTAHIPVSAFQALLEQFRQANFLSALDQYGEPGVDGGCRPIVLIIGALRKRVADCADFIGALPTAIDNLAQQIDAAADTKRWLDVDAGTLPWLLNQHWNFAAPTAVNFDIYSHAVGKKGEHGMRPLVEKYLAEKFPVVSPFADQASPICVASGTGDLALVRHMAAGIKSFQHPVPTECLQAAARSGSLDVFNFWRDHGAVLLQPEDPPQPGKGTTSYFRNLLNAAFQGQNPAIIRSLLHSGGDLQGALQFALQWGCKADLTQTIADIKAATGSLNMEADDFAVCPAAMRTLLNAGADPNTNFGTAGPMIDRYAYSEPAVRALLAAGAIPTPKTLAAAKEGLCNTCVALLQSALDKPTPP